MNWDDFRFFLALARHRTLKASAKLLMTDQATVGRRLYSLEKKLGAKLFEKRSDGFFLTAAGERIKSSVEEMENAAQSVDRQITGQDIRLEGTVRIALPGALANHLVIPLLEGFSQKFPYIQVHFLTGPEVLNLARREADIAFRLVRPTHAGLIVKKIGDVSLSLFGHRDFFEAQGKIKKIDEIGKFPFVGLYDYATSEAEKTLRDQMQPFVRISYLSAAWSSVYYSLSARAGLGILPDFLAVQNSDLKRVEVIASTKSTLWSVVHPEVHKSAKVAALLNYLVPSIKKALPT